MKLKRLKTLIFVLQFANLYFLYLCLYCWIFLEKYLEKIEQISLEERKYQNSFGQMFWFKGRKLWNVFRTHFSKDVLREKHAVYISAISPYKYVLPTRWMTGSFQVKIVYTATLSFFQSIQKKKRKFKPGVH